MKKITLLLWLLLTITPLLLFGQDVTYTFDSGGNGYTADNGSSWTNLSVYGGTCTTVAGSGLSDGNTTSVFKALTYNNSLSSADLTAIPSASNYSVEWAQYIVANNTIFKHGVILRAQSAATGFSAQARQGYYFSAQSVSTPASGSVRFRIVALTSSASNTTILDQSVTGLTYGGNNTGPLFIKATVNGTSLSFYYKTSAGAAWTLVSTKTDATYSSGTTQLTWGYGSGSNVTGEYIDNLGFTDLSKNVTADDNKFIYTGSALTPTISYPGFTSPLTTLTYTGTGATAYGPATSAPTAVGTYSLAVSASESGISRTGTFGFEIIQNTYDNIYTFKTDGAGNTPAGISYAQGATSGTGAVTSYSGIDNGAAATAITFRPTALGSVGNTGVADLTSFASSSSYSVTWKEYVTGNGYKKGFLLQGQTATNGYANDLKQGYLFVVYNDATNGTKCRIYTVGANPAITATDNANGSVANPAPGAARWYRATVGYGLQKFEYSDNGTNWITANTTSDLTFAGLPGSTQMVYGFGAGVGNYYYDYIASKAFTPIAATGGNWSEISWESTPNTNSHLTINNGELVVDQNQSVSALVIEPGAKLTINADKELRADVVILKSDATGTATFVNNGTAIVTKITAQQYLGTARNWYVSSPVSNAASPATNITRYYEYVEAGTNDPTGQPTGSTVYWKGLNTGTTMVVGKGYIAQASTETTVQFSGTPNNGAIVTSFNLTRDDDKGKGFNLVGNPYPSYIDWTDVAAANPNLDNTYYYRTKNTNLTNTYTFVTWNGAGSGSFVVSNGSLPANTSITRFIPPAQAFWVRVKSGTSATKMYFNNSMREHRDDNYNLMKVRKQDSRSSLRLQMHNGTESDEILVYLDNEASNNYDDFDSPKMMNNSASVPDLYSKAGVERLVINGLNSISDNTEIPLGFSLNAAATLKLKATEMSNFPEGTQVYLIDKVENKLTVLTPESEYNFSTTEATTNNESRFSLLFKVSDTTTGTVSPEKENVSVFVNTQNEIVIQANENSNFAIYNAVGQLITAGKTTSETQTLNAKLMKGVYVVKVNNQSTRVIVK